MGTYFVYMMTNRSRVVIYTGVTNNLEKSALVSRQSPAARLHQAVSRGPA